MVWRRLLGSGTTTDCDPLANGSRELVVVVVVLPVGYGGGNREWLRGGGIAGAVAPSRVLWTFLFLFFCVPFLFVFGGNGVLWICLEW